MFVRCSIQAPTFSWRHTKTHADINRCHSERDCHRSTTTTQLWNADMSTSSNYTKAFVQCCHGKHTGGRGVRERYYQTTYKTVGRVGRS